MIFEFILIFSAIGSIQLGRVILQDLKNKREYKRGFQDGVNRSILPLKQAIHNLESFSREDKNGDLMVTLILNNRE